MPEKTYSTKIKDEILLFVDNVKCYHVCPSFTISTVLLSAVILFTAICVS
jgi:hypothetical protein